jgi:antitoxin (DNA-binding transcriptional repressor) of toxin-antitoxin stability system
MSNISITHLARNLADIVNRVAYRGERFTVLRGRRPVAEVIPAPRGRRLSELSGILAGLPRLSAEDVEHFGHDIEEARRETGLEETDPWAS